MKKLFKEFTSISKITESDKHALYSILGNVLAFESKKYRLKRFQDKKKIAINNQFDTS